MHGVLIATEEQAKARIEDIRQAIRDENVSYVELLQLHELRKYIEDGDVELLEWAGVPEFDGE